MNGRGEYHHLTVYNDNTPQNACVNSRFNPVCSAVHYSGTPMRSAYQGPLGQGVCPGGAFATTRATASEPSYLSSARHRVNSRVPGERGDSGDMDKAVRLVKTASIVAQCSERCMRRGGSQQEQADCFSRCLARNL